MWLAVSTRPDLAYAVSHLAGERTVQALRLANQLIRKAKADAGLGLSYGKLGDGTCSDLQLVSFSDSSLQTEEGERSQQGQLYALVPGSFDVRTGLETPANIVHWRSGRLRRVARSSLTAETLAAGEGVDLLVALQEQWCEWLTGSLPDRPRQADRSSIGFELPKDTESDAQLKLAGFIRLGKCTIVSPW